MKGELSDYTRGLKGHVRLLANTSALSEVLRRFSAAFWPPIRTSMSIWRNGSATTSSAWSREGFCRCRKSWPISPNAGGLETFPFATDRLVLVMPRGHAFADRRTLPFRDLLDHAFVGLGSTSALQQHLQQHAAQAAGRSSFACG